MERVKHIQKSSFLSPLLHLLSF